MNRVAVESPLSGDFARNQRYARLCCIDCLRRGESPYASHLFFTQMLDERSTADRALGIAAGLEWSLTADIAAVYCDFGITDGMQQAIDLWAERADGGSETRALEWRTLPPELLGMLDSKEPLSATPGSHTGEK